LFPPGGLQEVQRDGLYRLHHEAKERGLFKEKGILGRVSPRIP
jgi:hypothetical protein